MVLDHECVRAVLLAVEACPYGKTIRLPALHEKLPEYSDESLNYTCLKLEEGGYLDASFLSAMRQPLPVLFEIKCMTYAGHEFLDTVRDDTNWGKVKDIAKKSGVFSLKAIVDIGKDVAAAAIASALQGR